MSNNHSGSKPPVEESSSATNHQKLTFPVVAIGASAGGLEAVRTILKDMSSCARAAFVVISHVPASAKSRLGEVLASHTSLRIHAVTGPVALEPGVVYTMSTGRDLVIHNAVLEEAQPEEVLPHRPIDRFMSSLAEDQGSNCVGLILTGAGFDGCAGVRSINTHGGLVLAQDPVSAEYPSMPESAIQTGLVDMILPLEKIGSFLRELLSPPRLEFFTQGDLRSLPDYPELSKKIMAMLVEFAGHDLSGYKQSTISRRIQKRMLLCGCHDLAGYLGELEKKPEERAKLFADLLIGVTSFFRDHEAFHVLSEEALPQIFQGKEPGDFLRAWVAGCATGQEAYSLAMLLNDQAKLTGAKCQIKIFASDIDQKALAVARAGVYPARVKTEISPEHLKRYFTCSAKTCAVNPELRDSIVFAYHDLLQDPPFSGLDLVLCRNVLIYLKPEGQKKILSELAYALNPGGFLLLGPAESIGQEGNHFEPVDKKWRLFKRKGRINGQRLPLLRAMRRINFDPGHLPQNIVERPMALETMAEKAMLKHFGHAGALVDTNLRILHCLGDTTAYLELPEGEPSLNILKLAKKNLRLRLRTAFNAAQEGKQSSMTGPIPLGPGAKHVNILVDPLLDDTGALDALLVIFDDSQAQALDQTCHVVDIPDENALIARYENELTLAADHIQHCVERYETLNEELKASNEELVTMNEELQSSNEELDSSREELQSLNEELSSINAELQAKVDELALANSFVENLLKSSNAAKVVLDEDLNLVRHTLAAQELFLIMPGDEGHPLGMIKRLFEDRELIADCQNVLQTGHMVEREIVTNYGKWFTKRVHPFLSPKGEVSGVVLCFDDITKLKQAEEVLKHSNEDLEAMVRARTEELRESELKFRTVADFTYDWEYWLAPDGAILWVSPSCKRFTGYGPEEFLADSTLVERIVHPEDKTLFHEHMLEIISGSDTPCELDFRIIHRQGQQVWINHHCQTIIRADGVILGRRVSNRDITDRKLAEQSLRESQEHFRQLVEGAPELIFVQTQGRFAYLNPAALTAFGATEPRQLLGQAIVERFPPEFKAVAAKRIEQVNKNRLPQPAMEYPYFRLDGGQGFIELVSVPIVWQGENGALTFAREVSDRRRGRVELERAKEAAEAANKAKGEFLANMSHELRTPLNGMLGMLQLMERDPQLSHDQKSLLATAMESGRGLLTIINDILSFVQIEAGRMHIGREQVDPREIMDSICRAFRYEATTKGLMLSATVEDNVPATILSDAGRLRQIIFNLLGNAMKFTEHGRITVRAQALPFSPNPKDRTLLFTVSDTGIGIAEDNTKKIFEPFTQADSSLTRKYQGTGMGLGIVHQLVGLMGGCICVDSNEGQGTTIYFTVRCGWASPIPIGPEIRPMPVFRRPQAEKPLAGLKVLVAEDDDVNMITATRFLQHWGCTVQGAKNGQLALELLAKNDFDLLILDIQMPVLNGLDTAKAIRSSTELGAKAKIPILAMTAHAMPGEREQFLKAGMDGYIAKPMEMAELCRLIQDLIGRKTN